MGPIDYSIDVASPMQSIAQGYQLGAGIRQDQFAQQQQQAALAQQQQQKQLLSALAANPNSTGADYARVIGQIPAMAEPLSKAWAVLNPAQQETKLSNLMQWGSAVQKGQPQVAADGMNARADAIENSNGGRPTPESQAYRTSAQAVLAHPELASGIIQAQIGANPDSQKAAEALKTLQTIQKTDAEAPADLLKKQADAREAQAKANIAVATTPALIDKPLIENKNVMSQIAERSAKLVIDRDKLTSEYQMKRLELEQKFGELPEYVAKDVNAAAVNSIASAQSAEKMRGLADKIDKTVISGGVPAKVAETWAKTFGGQDELTRIRGEYSRIVTPAAMAAYKQVASGSTSDKDIETAMVGVPSDTANAETMSAFLRGAAKLQTYSAVLDNAKSEWLAANKNLGKTKTDLEIDGTKVPAGATFKTFVDSYLPRKIEQANAATLVNRLAQKYGPQAAAPATAEPASPVLGD